MSMIFSNLLSRLYRNYNFFLERDMYEGERNYVYSLSSFKRYGKEKIKLVLESYSLGYDSGNNEL